MPPKTTAASLPKITTLRHELDYGDAGSDRCAAFYDDVRAFRKKFHTRNGIPGINLHDWKSQEHQSGLSEMTVAYLDTHGNGPLFWPDDPSAANFNKLQYSRDITKIRRLMKQLFFRLNEQQYRNHKYKNKDKPESSTVSLGQRGRSTEQPIDIDTMEDNPEVSPTPLKIMQPDNTTSTINAWRRELKRGRSHVEDTYDVPQSPEFEEIMTQQAPRRLDGTRQTGQFKRLKSEDVPPAQATKHTRDDNKPPEPASKRKSPRQKKTMQMEDYATGEDYITVMTSMDPLEERDHGAASGSRKAPVKVSKSGSVVTFRGLSRPTSKKKNTTPSDSHLSPIQGTPFVASDTNQPQKNQPPPLQRPQASKESNLSPRQNSIGWETPPVTSTISGAAEESRLGSEEFASIEKAQTQAPPQTFSGKPKIDFIYRVVLSRIPVFSSQKWKPSRKLEEMSFRQFMEELPLGGALRGLILTVEGPGLRAVEEIPQGDETGFDSLIKLIKRAIRGQLGHRGTSVPPLVYEIEIEPMRSDDAMAHVEVDDEDFTI
ncbi:hypothetical protein F5B20DRAFT_189652 [Whalleya microplaca]|nr:hypothetical protein F5B20DRAFT_189652 [Whalleya microplaca]